MTALPDLLARLAELEPGRWQVVDHRTPHTVKLLGRDDEADEWLNLGWWPREGGGAVVRERDLRALLEQACEARGWQWTASFSPPAEYRAQYRAEVQTAKGFWNCEGDNPAHALAAAYVGALTAKVGG